jgi:hypothetical protein
MRYYREERKQGTTPGLQYKKGQEEEATQGLHAIRNIMVFKLIEKWCVFQIIANEDSTSG